MTERRGRNRVGLLRSSKVERKSKENNEKTVVDREGDKLGRMQVGRQTEGSKRRNMGSESIYLFNF